MFASIPRFYVALMLFLGIPSFLHAQPSAGPFEGRWQFSLQGDSAVYFELEIEKTGFAAVEKSLVNRGFVFYGRVDSPQSKEYMTGDWWLGDAQQRGRFVFRFSDGTHDAMSCTLVCLNRGKAYELTARRIQSAGQPVFASVTGTLADDLKDTIGGGWSIQSVTDPDGNPVDISARIDRVNFVVDRPTAQPAVSDHGELGKTITATGRNFERSVFLYGDALSDGKMHVGTLYDMTDRNGCQYMFAHSNANGKEELNGVVSSPSSNVLGSKRPLLFIKAVRL